MQKIVVVIIIIIIVVYVIGFRGQDLGFRAQVLE